MQALLLLIVALFVLNSEACNQRRPPPPPPPKAPPAPEAPPPIVKVVRTQEQNVGFNQCYRKCEGSTTEINEAGEPTGESQSAFGVSCERDGQIESTYGGGLLEDTSAVGGFSTPTGAPCAMQTDCKYECKFTVYTEVALRTITKPTGCGCAFHINIVNPRPARVVGAVKSAHVAQSVSVGDFKLVVWNYKSNRVVETIPDFDLEADESTKARIANQVQEGNTGDFTSLTAGFAGEVTRFENLPASLNLNLPENAEHVPALAFEVTQVYNDIKTWDPPQKPDLEKMPNAWQSQCVPYWDHKPFCYNSKKRQINQACDSLENNVWMKKFFLFPKESQISQAQGVTFAARLITSFYTTSNCKVENGIFSVDSEFTQSLSATDGGASMALGTWAWDRVFVDGEDGASFGTKYIHGVPKLFSGIQEVWDKGYSTIQWFSPRGWNVAHDSVIDHKICQSFSPTQAAQPHTKYGETGEFFNKQAGIRCSPFDDVIYQDQCGVTAAPDRSLMAFINEGAVLNFNKNEDSIMIMGKMDSGCRVQPFTDTVFDVLTFHGVTAGQEPITRDEKRAVHDDYTAAGLIYDAEVEGLRHFLHRDAGHLHHPSHAKRAVVDELVANLATAPNEADYDMRVATGSVNIDGTAEINDGDHPLELFPETFSAPISIDPQVDTDEAVDAEATTGSIRPPCNKGSIGCSCRVTGDRACDLGLECDAQANCMLKDCQAGEPGCPCLDNDKCNGDQSECNVALQVCAVKSSCAVGTAGCECAAGASCSDSSNCFDGLCLLADGCPPGTPGCECSLQGDCSDGFNCDALMGVCVAPRCTSGDAGCRCKGDGSCSEGFQCNTQESVCSSFKCEVGDPGCQCLDGNKCNKVGFTCASYSTTGDARCVAKGDVHLSDADRVARCKEACGGTMGNVKICPQSPTGAVYCHEINPIIGCSLAENKDSYFCQNGCAEDPFKEACVEGTDSASTLALSAMAIIAAVVAF